MTLSTSDLSLARFHDRPTADVRVIVGMSGGVDSSVSAALLQSQGYQVEGLFMKNWEEDDGTEYCTAMADLADAKAVCQKLGIELHTANFAMEYWDRVFEHFLAEYQAGRTPNPDILCNKEIKFKAFLEYATQLGADFIATGHYCRRGQTNNEGTASLLRGLDNNKDQSYFLYAVGGDKIAQTLFPVGNIHKPEVRRIARQYDLITSNKKDSTGICFIGERRFKDFLQQFLPAQPGNIITDDGDILGRHDGLMYYTLGQRGGIGVGGVKNRPDEPWFVLSKDLDNNALIVGQGHHHPLLMSQSLTASQCDWNAGRMPEQLSQDGLRCTAKTRYRQPDQECVVKQSSIDATKIDVQFTQSQRAVTPGQSVVFYQDEICLGGGIIESCST